MWLKYSEGLIKDRIPVARETEKGVFDAVGLPAPCHLRRLLTASPFGCRPKTTCHVLEKKVGLVLKANTDIELLWLLRNKAFPVGIGSE